MLISSLQQFLRLLVPPLVAAGINASSQKNVSASLESLADGLDPFKEMSLDQLSELLRIAQEYRETGQIPDWAIGKKPKTPKLKESKPPKAPKLTLTDAVVRLRDLQHRSSSLEPAQVRSEMAFLSILTVNELKEVQREFLGGVMGSKKPQLLAALQKKIEDFRASQDRVESIRLF
jgi:hypothetical protein